MFMVVQVVCATLTGALGGHLHGKNGVFDVVYVDEAAQVSPSPAPSNLCCLQCLGRSVHSIFDWCLCPYCDTASMEPPAKRAAVGPQHGDALQS